MKNFPKSISQNRNVAAVKLKWGLNDNCRPFHTKSVQLSVVYIWKDKIMLHVFLCKMKMTQAQLLTFRSTEWLINLLLFHILTYKCNNKKNGIYISIFLPDSAPQTLVVLILNYIYMYFLFIFLNQLILLYLWDQLFKVMPLYWVASFYIVFVTVLSWSLLPFLVSSLHSVERCSFPRHLIRYTCSRAH